MDGLVYLHAPRSSAQQKYTQERLAEQRRQRALALNASADQPESSVPPYATDTQAAGGQHDIQTQQAHQPQQQTESAQPQPVRIQHQHGSSHDSTGPDPRKNPHYPYVLNTNGTKSNQSSAMSTISTTSSEQANQSLLNDPFELRHGRRYLRDVPYPLPVDLTEVHRQNLQTLLGCKIFGRAICCPSVKSGVPRRVLEVGCGSAFWSASCHKYFASLGHTQVGFTGLDVAPLAPDLRRQGINWTFVQHDIRRFPWPFDDGQFDMVMLKDTSLMLPLGVPSENLLEESMRLLAKGGHLEIWETDHVLRSLLPHPTPPPRQHAEKEIASRTGTFLISPGTQFAPVQNKYLQQANAWIEEALDRRKFPPTPCARTAGVLFQEPDLLGDVGARRIAVPLGELRWERSGKQSRRPSEVDLSATSPNSKCRTSGFFLTSEQADIRQTALVTVLQKIESLEPLLREASGKNSEEWSYWWSSMIADLQDPSKGTLAGECLEFGAWWATKLHNESK